jgi:hypothetical protein
MARGPEAKVKDKIINILKFHEAWYCFPATRGMGRSGVPDILVCHRGAFIGIEVKATINNKPTPLQEHELFKLQQSGGWACVIHADNLLDLEGLMSTITAMAEITRLQGHDKLDAIEEKSKAIEAADELARHKPKDEDSIN